MPGLLIESITIASTANSVHIQNNTTFCSFFPEKSGFSADPFIQINSFSFTGWRSHYPSLTIDLDEGISKKNPTPLRKRVSSGHPIHNWKCQWHLSAWTRVRRGGWRSEISLLWRECLLCGDNITWDWDCKRTVNSLRRHLGPFASHATGQGYIFLMWLMSSLELEPFVFSWIIRDSLSAWYFQSLYMVP